MKRTATVNEFIKKLPIIKIVRSQNIEYINIECAFDIETSSFFEGEEPRACMYGWVFGIADVLYLGRTWEEFTELLETIAFRLGLNEKRRLLVYVHNLGFELGFLMRRFNWKKIFSIKPNRPIYALTDYGIEFRCSYLLSGYSLAKLADTLPGEIRKLEGDIDYKLIRHTRTQLTDKEREYMYRDVEIVLLYIRGLIKKYQTVANIPLTKTGVVRRYCKQKCLDNNYTYYHGLMCSMPLSVEAYQQLKRTFSGGITHASSWTVERIYYNVVSWDICSSYPTVMISEKYPIGSSELINITSDKDKEFNFYIDKYCCVFDVQFTNLQEKHLNAHILSDSKCITENVIIDNGKVVECSECKTSITNIDYKILKDFYKWDKCIITNFRAYRAEYLPTEYVRSVLDFYEKKTTLKGVNGKDEEYLNIKEMLNSMFGMCVTDIVRDEINVSIDENTYEWKIDKSDIEKQINKYNESKKRFLSYEWGIFVTAYARYNITRAIINCGEDFIYCDTDSVKIKNSEKHRDFFTEYNKNILKKLTKALEYHGIDKSKIAPQTAKGITKPLGFFEIDAEYDRFKTLGAKRYIYEKNGEISITVSGLNKKVVVPYLKKKYKTDDRIFEEFKEGLYIPRGKTGKNIHTYIPFETRGIITDYLGNTSEYIELSSVNLTESDYSLTITPTYREYIDEINKSRI